MVNKDGDVAQIPTPLLALALSYRTMRVLNLIRWLSNYVPGHPRVPRNCLGMLTGGEEVFLFPYP